MQQIKPVIQGIALTLTILLLMASSGGPLVTQSTTTVPGPTAGMVLHCDYSIGFTAGAVASTVLVTGVASNRITVCGFTLTLAATGTAVLGEATTGTTCATAFVNRAGPFDMITGVPVSFTPGDSFAFNTVTAGKDLCITTTGTSAAAHGVLSFMIRP